MRCARGTTSGWTQIVFAVCMFPTTLTVALAAQLKLTSLQSVQACSWLVLSGSGEWCLLMIVLQPLQLLLSGKRWSSVVRVTGILQALKHKVLAPFNDLLGRLSLLYPAPPDDGVVIGVRHTHHPLRKGRSHLHWLVFGAKGCIQPVQQSACLAWKNETYLFQPSQRARLVVAQHTAQV